MDFSKQQLTLLIVGSGAREHALAKAARRSAMAGAVLAAPGNAGIAEDATCHAVKADDVPGLVALARREKADFVIVGPEVPLSLGLVDALEKESIPAFGPRQAGAQLEASKVYTKNFLLRNRIPTAYGETFTAAAAALEYIKHKPLPIVIKASGLAAGKGVTVAQTRAEAEAAIRASLDEKIFGASGEEILIEDFLPGEEASMMLVVCGEKYLVLPPSQDHKRAGDGDTGANTGGMGAYAPAAVVDAPLLARIEKEIIRPTLAAFTREGIDYRGVLYIGLMLTPAGPSVVEFNVRFGDPECQVLLPLLATDPIKILWDCANGALDAAAVKLQPQFSAAVVLAAHDYPANPRAGDVITLPPAAALPKGVDILHAGTKRRNDGALVTAGGRVLNVVATGTSLRAALDAAYAVCAQIKFAGMHYRQDIGARQLAREQR
ncbi:MAG TPA: phosphoribosylamine--glycine ligase [Opitutales bacterium]|nr:phosphoribosylamine--glycine ligase [Opitutales bacterium]